MNEFDEDIDPQIGPIADLMTEYNLLSTVKSNQSINDNKSKEIFNEKLYSIDYISYININFYFKQFYSYPLNIYWSKNLKKHFPNIDQSTDEYVSLKPLIFLFITHILYIKYPNLSFVYHLFLFYVLLTFIIYFLLPIYIYYTWFNCLKTIKSFLNTIQTHQQWLIQIHGFHYIRPMSNLFENQLYNLRRTLFDELKKHFLLSRQIARKYSILNQQLICTINLDEFGSLINSDNSELNEITNKYDQISIKSMNKLYNLQINETIQIINLNRPKIDLLVLLINYNKILVETLNNINKIKQNCSIILDEFDEQNTEKYLSKKLTSAFYLLRSICEQLFQMNENEQINDRIVQDLKIVIHLIESLKTKRNQTSDHLLNEQILSNENNTNSSNQITSYHRFDDQIEQTTDEILVCDTGKIDDQQNMNENFVQDNDDYDRKLLREQTNSLMKELQIAIQGKQKEWNEREQRLLGHIDEQIQIEDKKTIVIDEQQFEKVPSLSNTTTMLDELKHTFLLNKNKLNIDDDIFGEDDDDDD